MRFLLTFSFVLILLSTSDYTFPKKKDPVVTIGVKLPFGFHANHSTSTNLSFLDTNGGSLIGVGLSADIILFRNLAVELGTIYRVIEYGNLQIKELQFPMLLKLRLPLSRSFIFLVGGGVAYLHELSGEIDPADTVNPAFGQGSISLPDQDLRNRFSFILKMEFQSWLIRDTYFLSIEMAYEKTKRALNISSDDIIFSIGMNFKVY